MLQRRIELCGDAPRAPLQPCKRRVRPPTGGPPAQGRSTPEQAQSEKSQGVRGTESPDPSITDQRNRELRVRFFGGTTKEIRRVYDEHKGRYGSPRITQQLRKEGMACGENRVARLMRENGLAARAKKAFRPRTTTPGQEAAPNLIKQIKASGPDQ